MAFTLPVSSSGLEPKNTAILRAAIDAGATPMIGRNDDGTTFTLDNACTLISLVSFWAIQRDEACPSVVERPRPLLARQQRPSSQRDLRQRQQSLARLDPQGETRATFDHLCLFHLPRILRAHQRRSWRRRGR
jgi:hypothetical protein